METKYLTEGPVNQKDIARFIKKMSNNSNTGGHSIFLGQVRRDEVNGRKVRAIEYSSYESMVKAEAVRIKEILFSEFDDVKSIDIIHSTGIVEAGGISLLVFVSAGHRHQAIEACRKSVELIKEKFPVWKKEIFEDNTHEWRKNEPH